MIPLDLLVDDNSLSAWAVVGVIAVVVVVAVLIVVAVRRSKHHQA